MGLFFYNKIGSIISIEDLPTTNIIEPLCQLLWAEERLESLYIVDFMVVLVYYYFQLLSEISPLLSQISFPLSH